MHRIFPVALVAAVLLIAPLFITIKGNNQSSFGDTKEAREENPMEAYEALTFLTAMNAFPNSDIPHDAYNKAWQRHKELLATEPRTIDQTPWQNIGPTNVGGRTISIALDPTDTSVIWLGSASGGLWKSTSGGIGPNAWTYVPTGFPVLGVGGIAINPANHLEMFIGTGEVYSYGTSTNGLVDRTQRGSYGIGILKSEDGGVTWSTSLDWSFQQQTGVWEINYSPKNTRILLAATTEGIYRTTDEGITWNNVMSQKMAMDLQWDPVDTNVVYAGVGNEQSTGKGIYKSTDGGRTWTLLNNTLPPYTNDGRIMLCMDPSNHNTIMAYIANSFSTVGLYRSTDAGQTWTLQTRINLTGYQGWYAKGLLIKANDPSQVLAPGIDFYKSTDYGQNFFAISDWAGVPPVYVHADIHDVIANPLDPDKIYVITDGGLFRSNNFGATFYECNSGYVSGQFYIGSASATDPNLALGGLQDNNTFIYTGSSQWTPSNIGGDGSYNAIDQLNDHIQYASAQYLYVAKSTDRGNEFDSIFYPIAQGLTAFLAPFVLSASNQQVIYAGSSTLFKSTNGGSTWAQAQPDPVDNGNAVLSIGISATNSDNMYFATAPTDINPMHVFRSDDGGIIIQDISAGLPNRYPSRIAVNPNNDQEVFVVYSGFGGGHIFKSENGGDSWTDISTSLPDLPFHCLAIDPLQPNNIYAGCDFTIYASTDGGQSWFTYADGFPDAAMVFDLVISPVNRQLLAFTHGHGVYRNDLLNANVGVPPIDTPSIAVYPNPTSGWLSINTSKIEFPIVIDIYNSSGMKMKEEKRSSATNEKINVDLSSLSPGSYLLSMSGNNFSAAKKVVVLR